MLRFGQIFLTVGLTSGFLLGILSYLLLERILKRREAVEAALEEFRLKVLSQRTRVLGLAILAVAAIDRSVYGFRLIHRLFAALLIAALVSAGALGFLWIDYVLVSPELRKEKASLERAVNPWLYEMATNPANAKHWKDAFKTKIVSADPDLGVDEEFVNRDGLSEAIRKAFRLYDGRLARVLVRHPQRAQITNLIFFEGTYLRRGFQGAAFMTLVLFNAALNILAAAGLLLAIGRLRRTPALRIALACLGGLSALCLVLYGIAAVSYLNFFLADANFFVYLLEMFCGLVLASLLVGQIVFLRSGGGEKRPSRTVLLLGVLAGIGVFWKLQGEFISSTWEAVRFLLTLKPMPWVPFVISIGTIFPLFVVLCALGLAVAVKLATEGLRETLAAHFDFMRREAGSSNIAAAVALISFLIALGAGLLGL